MLWLVFLLFGLGYGGLAYISNAVCKQHSNRALTLLKWFLVAVSVTMLLLSYWSYPR